METSELKLKNIHPDVHKSLPIGIRIFTWATAIRWMSWGFVEAVVPVFIFSFTASFAEAGLLRSIYNIVFMLTLPFVGMLADKISARVIVMIGLLLYPFIGLSYFFAGFMGLAAFIVIARVINGVAYAFDSVGRGAYFMRMAPKNKVSSAFGYFDTVTSLVWIAALGISLFLVEYFQFHTLFLLIIPFHIIAFFMVARVKSEPGLKTKDGLKTALSKGVFKGLIKEIRSWKTGLRMMGLLVFILGFISSFADFFIPILAYTHGASLQQVILIAAALSAPRILGIPLGKFADNRRSKAILISLGVVTLLLFILSVMQSYVWQIVAVFVIGFVKELIVLAGNGVMTSIASPSHYGRVTSGMHEIQETGKILGPLMIGFLIDQTSDSRAFLFTGIGMVVVLIFFFLKRGHLEAVHKK